ncbi:unnamed protein product [Lathyrus oleraceus]|uniref:Uncharacterized protein n=1 Tax=Pisum sativum TaxID=3888 RepID=A0A9D5A6P9_PEA|nr:hypothetical protein KIW84_064870 [Pisum sativum]
MDSLNRIRNHLGTPTIFLHITCLFLKYGWIKPSNPQNQSSSNQIPIPISSLIDSPKKIINKISKAIIPFTICFKSKHREELSTNSKNAMKKIYKEIHNHLKKMKKQEDDKCLWKKTILMGEKCQPLEFPGAIFYDSEGNQLSAFRATKNTKE